MRPRRKNDYNSMSAAGKSLANRAKRAFAKDYPDAVVSIDGRMGWIMVDGKKVVNLSRASSRPMELEDVLDKMKQAYLGSAMQESNMRLSKRQLRNTIRNVLRESGMGIQTEPNIDAEMDRVAISYIADELGLEGFQGNRLEVATMIWNRLKSEGLC